MKKKAAKKSLPARRKISMRSDATVGTALRKIEAVFGLPTGSVRLLNPDKNHARIDKRIGTLLRDWDY